MVVSLSLSPATPLVSGILVGATPGVWGAYNPTPRSIVDPRDMSVGSEG